MKVFRMMIPVVAPCEKCKAPPDKCAVRNQFFVTSHKLVVFFPLILSCLYVDNIRRMEQHEDFSPKELSQHPPALAIDSTPE